MNQKLLKARKNVFQISLVLKVVEFWHSLSERNQLLIAVQIYEEEKTNYFFCSKLLELGSQPSILPLSMEGLVILTRKYVFDNIIFMYMALH